MSQNEGVEDPIFIESLQHHRDHSYIATNGDANHRFPIRPEEIWNEYSTIPDVPPAGLIADGAVVGDLTMFKSKALTQVVGTTQKFELATPGDLARVVPATFGQVAPVSGSLAPTLTGSPATGYTPVIVDSTGAVFPQQSSSWVVDGLNNYVEFPYGVPSTMIAPFSLTFVKYTGLVGGGSCAPAVPNAVDLWVAASPTGSDTTGHGTMVAPYLTIERALQDIRQSGWNDTATITIMSSAGTYTFPSGSVSFNAGSCGAQRTPLRIKGDTVTTVGSHVVDAATLANASSGLLELHATAAFAVAPGSLGNRIRFTSGAMSTLTKGGAFANTVQAQLPIASVLAADTVILPFDATTTVPGAGDTFDVETLDTRVALAGVMVIQPNSGAVIFEDFNLDVTSVGGQGGIVAENTLIGTYGINVTTVGAGVDLVLENVEGGWLAGLCDDDLADGYELTTKSLFIDTTAAGTQLIKLPDLDNKPRQWGNTVLLADPAGAAALPIILSGSVSASYWENTAVIQPALDNTLALEAFHIQSSRSSSAALWTTGGIIYVSKGLIDSAANTSLEVRGGGNILSGSNYRTVSPLIITNPLEQGVYVVSGTLQLPEITIDSAANTGVFIASGGTFICDNTCVITNGTLSGLIVEGFASIAGVLTSTGNRRNVNVRSGGKLRVQNVVATGAEQEGIIVNNGSSMISIFGDVDASGSNTTGFGTGNIRISEQSTVTIAGTLTSTGAVAGSGLTVQGASSLQITGVATLTGNLVSGLVESGLSTICIGGALDVSDGATASTGPGMDIAGSKLTVAGTVTASGANTGNGITAINCSALCFGGAVMTSGNTQHGIQLANSSLVALSTLTSSSNGSNGLRATTSSVTVSGAATMSSNTIGLHGLSSSRLYFASTVSAVGNAGNNIILGKSVLYAPSDAVTATGSVSGSGIVMSDHSEMTTGFTTTLTDNKVSGLVMIESSRMLVNDGNLDVSDIATGNLTGPGISLTNSSLDVIGTFAGASIIANGGDQQGIRVINGSKLFTNGSITATSNAGTNVEVVDSSSVYGFGLTATGSTAAIGVFISNASKLTTVGSATLTDNKVAGLSMDRSSDMLVSNGSIDASDVATGNLTGQGISLVNSTLEVVNGTITANGGDQQGIQALNCSKLFTNGPITATGNASDNINIQSGSSVIGSTVTATGSTSGSGIVIGVNSAVTVGSATLTDNKVSGLVMDKASNMLVSNGSLDVSDIATGNLTGPGISLENSVLDVIGGSITANGSDQQGILVVQCSKLFTNGSITATGNNSNNIDIRSGSSVIGSTVTATGSTSGSGVVIDDNSAMTTGSTTTLTDNEVSGLDMTRSSTMLVKNGTLDVSDIATGNLTGPGISLANSVLEVLDGSVVANGSDQQGILVVNCSKLFTNTTVTATDNTGNNIEMRTGSQIIADFALTATGSTSGSGVVISNGSELTTESATLTNNKVSGLVMDKESNMLVSNGSLDVSDIAAGNLTGPGISLTNSALDVIGGSITANGSDQQGILVIQCSKLFTNDSITATGNTSNNIDIQSGSSVIGSTVTATGSASGSGAVIDDNSAMTTGSTTTLTDNEVSGLIMTRSSTMLVKSGTLDVSDIATGNLTGPGINLANSVLEVIDGSVVANGSDQQGILIVNCSKLFTNTTVTATGNTGNNIEMRTGSQIIADFALTATGSTSGSGVVISNGSELTTESATLTDNKVSGLVMDKESNMLVSNGSLDVSDIATGNLTGPGIRLENSVLDVIGGSITANGSDQQGILAVNCSKLFTNNSTTATGNTGNNIEIGIGSTVAGGTITATGSASNGIDMYQSSVLISFDATVSGNGSDGINIRDNSVFDASGSVNTTSSTSTGFAIDGRSTARIGGNLDVSISGATSGSGLRVTSSDVFVASSIRANLCTTDSGISLGNNSSVIVGSDINADTNQNANLSLGGSSKLSVNGSLSTIDSDADSGVVVGEVSNLYVGNALTTTGNADRGLLVSGNCTIRVGGALTASSNANNGIDIRQLSFIHVGSTVTANDCTQNGIRLGTGGFLACDDEISVTGCNVGLEILERSTLINTTTTTVSDAVNTGARIRSGSYVNVGSFVAVAAVGPASTGYGLELESGTLDTGNVTATGWAPGGIEIRTCSSMCITNSVTATGNAGTGLRVSGASRAVIGNTLTTSTNGSSNGIDVSSGGYIQVLGMTTSSGSTGGTGIRITGCSNACFGDVITNTNTSYGINVESSFIQAGTVTATGNTDNGIYAINAKLLINAPTTSSNISSGIRLVTSDMDSTTVVSSSNTGGSGLNINGSRFRIAGNLTINLNGVGGAFIGGSSVINVQGTITANTNTGDGLIVENGSTCSVNGTIGMDANTDRGLNGKTGAIIIVGDTFTVANHAGGSAISLERCEMRCRTINVAGANLTGIEMASSLLETTNPIDVSSTTGTGCSLTQKSRLFCAGAFTASSCGDIGVSIRDSSVADFSNTVVASSNSSIGISVDTKSTARIAGAVTTTSNTGNQIRVDNDSKLLMQDTVTARLVGGIGLTVDNGSSAVVLGTATLTDNATTGLRVDNGSSCLLNVADVSDTVGGNVAGNGCEVRAGSKLTCKGRLTSNGCGGAGVGITESNALFRGGITAGGNGGNGVDVLLGSIVQVSGTLLGATNSGATGLNIRSGSKVSNSSSGGANVIRGTGAATDNVIVGTNANASWATIAGALPADATDYGDNSGVVCEVCSCSYVA